MKKLTEPGGIIPARKIVPPPPKAKRRFDAKVVKLAGSATLPAVFAQAQGRHALMICTGATLADLPRKGVAYAARIRVDIESYYRFQKRQVHFVFVVPEAKISREAADMLADMGSALVRDRDGAYHDEAIAERVKRNDFFFQPQFDAETVKRLAIASLDSLETFYIKDLSVQEV